MFPLEQTVLPSAVVPLHIFEERYRALARHVAALDEPEFGTTMIERGREVGGDDLRSEVGVVARIVGSQELPDGRWGIVAIATRRIRVDRWLRDDPYPRARVTDWPDSDADIDPERIDQLRALLKRISDAARQIAPGRGIDEPAKDTPSFAGPPKPRGDASICPREYKDDAELVTRWLRAAIRDGSTGAPWEGDFPRYVWLRVLGRGEGFEGLRGGAVAAQPGREHLVEPGGGHCGDVGR